MIGYVFATWMREEISLQKEITKHNEKVENIMIQVILIINIFIVVRINNHEALY